MFARTAALAAPGYSSTAAATAVAAATDKPIITTAPSSASQPAVLRQRLAVMCGNAASDGHGCSGGGCRRQVLAACYDAALASRALKTVALAGKTDKCSDQGRSQGTRGEYRARGVFLSRVPENELTFASACTWNPRSCQPGGRDRAYRSLVPCQGRSSSPMFQCAPVGR